MPLNADNNSKRTLAFIAIALVLLITAFHYGTDAHHISAHNVYRRLYYLPILVAAFAGGLRGGLLTALIACALYIPHAFLVMHGDPSPTIDKLMEMLLFLVVGALAGLLVSQRDRAQERVEAALRERDELERELVRAGKLSAVGEVAAGLAHEIRNPLASIMGSAEALGKEFPEDHRKHRISQLMLREIERLDRVIRCFLEFARPATPQRRDIDLMSLVEGLQSLVDHRTSSVDIVLPEPRRAQVFADPDQATQVLLNLLLNGLEAVEGEGATGEVRIRFDDRMVGKRPYLCVGIQDSGPGIPEKFLESIFDPYFTTKANGTGLGLSLSSRIMEAHDGFLHVEPTPGANTVWACFPAERIRAVRGAELARSEPAEGPTRDRASSEGDTP